VDVAEGPVRRNYSARGNPSVGRKSPTHRATLKRFC